LFHETPTTHGAAVTGAVVGAAVTGAVVGAVVGAGVAVLEQAEAMSAAIEMKAAALRLTIIEFFLLWKCP
jgi:uncharacterized protein YcfJ